VPTPTTVIDNNSQGSSIPQNLPLDVTMLAIMGLTLAGAGMMKTQTAVAKQNEQATQQAQALAQLQAQQSAQKQVAQANWADNQAMQASAKQAVVTKVTQSQANIEFMDSHNRWYRESTIKNLLIQLQQSVTLDGIRNTVNQAWGRYGATQDAELGVLFQYWMDTYGNIEGLLEEADIQDTNPFKTNMESAFGYEIQWGNTLTNNKVGQWKSLANLLASNLHIASYFNENILPSSSKPEPGLDVFRKYFAKIPDGTSVTIHLGEGNPHQGLVPLPNGADSIESDIYLGADVNVATITHEFGHQFDRWFEMSGLDDFKEDLDTKNPGGITGYLTKIKNGYSNFYHITGGRNLHYSLYVYGLNSFAGKQMLEQEVWADIFMTAVLSNMQPRLQVFSLQFQRNEDLYQEIVNQGGLKNPQDFITCDFTTGEAIITTQSGSITIKCGYEDIGWLLSINGEDFTNTANAIINGLWNSNNSVFGNIFELSEEI